MATITQSGMQTVAFAYEQLSVGAGVVKPTVSKYAPGAGGNGNAERAVLTVETAAIRYNYDGSVPSASSGHLLQPGDVVVIEGAQNVAQLQMFAQAAAGTVNLTYERYYAHN